MVYTFRIASTSTDVPYAFVVSANDIIITVLTESKLMPWKGQITFPYGCEQFFLTNVFLKRAHYYTLRKKSVIIYLPFKFPVFQRSKITCPFRGVILLSVQITSPFLLSVSTTTYTNTMNTLIKKKFPASIGVKIFAPFEASTYFC